MRRLPALWLCLCVSPALADPPEVLAAEAVPRGDLWQVSVTLAHPDTGWEHYADGWRVETEEGRVLGLRELLHPHETEQPFTRSLPGVAVPAGTRRLYIRARCLTDGWNEARTPLDLE